MVDKSGGGCANVLGGTEMDRASANGAAGRDAVANGNSFSRLLVADEVCSGPVAIQFNVKKVFCKIYIHPTETQPSASGAAEVMNFP